MLCQIAIGSVHYPFKKPSNTLAMRAVVFGQYKLAPSVKYQIGMLLGWLEKIFQVEETASD